MGGDLSIPTRRTTTVDVGRSAALPRAKASTAIGRWTVLVALCLAAVVGATLYGLWTGAGHRLPKLEAAVLLATVGLAVVPVASLLPPAGARLDDRRTYAVLLRLAAGLLSAGVALVHLAVIKQHADEYWLYGAFFVVLGLGQLAWALLVVWVPSRALYWFGAGVNAAVVVFFIVTRTVGTLIGPEASEPARVGFGDVASTVFEALVVALSLALLFGPRLRFRGPQAGIAGTGSLLTLLIAPQTALALQSAVASAPFVPHAG